MKTKQSKIIAAVAVVVLIAAMVAAYLLLSPGTTEGAKSITIEVVNSAGVSTTYSLSTDAEYLEQAMNEAEGFEWSGTEGTYGMTVDTVNGERADYTLDGAYWSFYVNGEYCNYGISEQPVNDGDAFSIVYTGA